MFQFNISISNKSAVVDMRFRSQWNVFVLVSFIKTCLHVINWLIDTVHWRDWAALHYLCSCMNYSCVCGGCDDIVWVLRYAGPETQQSSGGFVEAKRPTWRHPAGLTAPVSLKPLIISSSSRRHGLGTTEHGSSCLMNPLTGKYIDAWKETLNDGGTWGVRWICLNEKQTTAEKNMQFILCHLYV